jgi:transglutaminase-like putative cysteine protease
MAVVFPDLAVGDIAGIAYKIRDKEAIFPGHFSVVNTFSAYTFYEDAQLTVRAPTDMRLFTESHKLQELPVVAEGGMRTFQWRYQNLKPLQWNESDEGIWRIDESPSVVVSTFESYEAIAKAYGERALPKAEPTTRIRELAKATIGSETRPIDRARSLYEWVSKNITYGGNCIGVGAVVPRDTDLVLDNKMGDCKDHATLLQALLAAADIKSEQVLINASDLYDLTKMPVVSLVNHVMNYLPDFNLYLDATAKDIPFSYLPMGGYGKPVIHIGRTNALARTPDQQHEKAEQRLTMKIRLAKNGSATGELQVALRGLQAASTRAYMRDLNADGQRDFVKRSLSSYGFKGQGILNRGDVTGMTDQYQFSMTFAMSNYLDGGAAGAFVLAPVMWTPMPVMNYADVKNRIEPNRKHICYGMHSYETYEVTLEPGLKLVSLPPAIKIRSKIFDFSAKYQRNKTGVAVSREVHDKTPTSVCSAGDAAELHKQALPAAENLRTQVLYQR